MSTRKKYLGNSNSNYWNLEKVSLYLNLVSVLFRENVTIEFRQAMKSKTMPGAEGGPGRFPA